MASHGQSACPHIMATSGARREERITLRCSDCGAEKRAFPSEVYGSCRRYMRFSRDGGYRCKPCWDVVRRGKKYGLKTAPTHTSKACVDCGKVTPMSAHRARGTAAEYRCRPCYITARREGRTPRAASRMVTVQCPGCGKVRTYKPSALKRYALSHCITCKNQGERNWAWRGGSTKYAVYPKAWSRMRDRIRARDHYTCQMCGGDDAALGRKLSVHHIDYDRANLCPDNLIALCVSCHGLTNNNQRQFWTAFLSTRVQNREVAFDPDGS